MKNKYYFMSLQRKNYRTLMNSDDKETKESEFKLTI